MRALVLSGGGSHGAYQVGAIKALTEAGKSWDIICGVSVGAINGTQIAMYKPEQQKIAAQELENFWLTKIQGNDSVYRKHLPWYFNYLATLWKGSLYNTSPLLKILEETLDKKKLEESGVHLQVGAVSLTSGEYRSVSKESKNFVKWILASATMPLLFEPIKLENEKWVDGGIRNITPISDLEYYKNITEIDVILTGPKLNAKPSNKSFTSILDVGKRCAELAVDEVWRTDLLYTQFEKTHYVPMTIYFPSSELTYDAFNFFPQDMKQAIDLGYSETKKLLERKK